MRSRLEQSLLRQWYGQRPGWSLALAPLAWLLKGAAACRYRRFRRQGATPPVPLLVVGNISVGGTGKTPLVIALCLALKQRGLKPVVISRGYGSKAPRYPFVVTARSSVVESGDEPLLIARRAGVPVVIDANRRDALERALDYQPDIVISDDGLQHYALPRTAELVVLDGARGLGNGWCLPVGPLRESAARLGQVDWVLVNGGTADYPGASRMQLLADMAVNLLTGEARPLSEFAASTAIEAVAGIGNPERFFTTLEQAGLTIRRHAFPDHHAFAAEELAFAGRTVMMTEKDAVKCAAFAAANHWYLPVTAALPDGLVDAMVAKLGLNVDV